MLPATQEKGYKVGRSAETATQFEINGELLCVIILSSQFDCAAEQMYIVILAF